MHCRGQASLEFIFLLAALLAFLSVFVAFYSGLEENARSALDLQAAKSFVSEAENGSRLLNLMGEGSEKKFGYRILNEWRLSKSGGGWSLLVLFPSGKEASVPFPVEVSQEMDGRFFSETASFVLRKTGGKVVLFPA